MKTINCHLRPTERWASANLSPPENKTVKELMVCVDGRNYSLQVAPLQRLFLLHSGSTNVCRLKPIMQIFIRLKPNVDKYLRGIEEVIFKEKKNQKKKEKEWAIAHTLMIRFSEALTSMHIT